MADIVLLSLLTLAASCVGTMTGFGTSTIMVPVLVPFYGLPTTLLLVGIVHWFGDVWKILLFRQGLRWKLILQFGVVGILATLVGASLVFQVDETILSRLLGGLLLAYVVLLTAKPELKLRQNITTRMAGGALYGFSAGVFGIGGAIRGAVLSAYGLPKAVYISAAGAIGLAVDSGRLVTYISGGASLPHELWWGMLLFIPATLAGAGLGRKIVTHVPETKFRYLIAVGLVLIGAKLLLFP